MSRTSYKHLTSQTHAVARPGRRVRRRDLSGPRHGPRGHPRLSGETGLQLRTNLANCCRAKLLDGETIGWHQRRPLCKWSNKCICTREEFSLVLPNPAFRKVAELNGLVSFVVKSVSRQSVSCDRVVTVVNVRT